MGEAKLDFRTEAELWIRTQKELLQQWKAACAIQEELA
jgi:hypothetical protein